MIVHLHHRAALFHARERCRMSGEAHSVIRREHGYEVLPTRLIRTISDPDDLTLLLELSVEEARARKETA